MKARVLLIALVMAFSFAGTASAQTCDGFCEGPSADESCYCDANCFIYGDCCDDVCDFCADTYADECNCVPDCDGKDCGTDGCYGTCGDLDGGCDAGFGCVAGVCTEGACEDEGDIPDCDGVCGPESWLADDLCDDGTYGINFNCEEFEWDMGDCAPPCEPTMTCEEAGVDCGPHPECPEDADADCGLCEDGLFCTDDGLCDACSCDGLECGYDECGEPCGDCAEGFFCDDDQLCAECLCDEGWECGFADCGTNCGECGEGFGCVDHMCVAQTCADSCGGQGIGGCWCDDSCFNFGDCCPDVCDECPDEDAEACACVPECDGKECGWDGCWQDCGTCDEGAFCTDDGLCEVCECGDMQCGFNGCGEPCGDFEGGCDEGAFCDDDMMCQACDCGDAVCGVDECGTPCGDLEGECAEGAFCLEGACYEGAGCEESETPGCDGCACEECVGAADSFCTETAWDSLCVQQCLMLCGGCGDGAGCGDGVCEFPETCSSCPEDCGCPGALECGWSDELQGFDCVVGSCEDGMEMGCCDGDVLNKCVEVYGFITSDCTENGNVCGWFAGDEANDPGYYCGSADLLVDEDPDGAYPAMCPEFVCEADCTDLECGPDPLCGEDCGVCEDGLVCEGNACVECQPDCGDLECGADPVCGTECGPCEDGFLCEEGMCVACEPDCTDLECGADPICG